MAKYSVLDNHHYALGDSLAKELLKYYYGQSHQTVCNTIDSYLKNQTKLWDIDRYNLAKHIEVKFLIAKEKKEKRNNATR